MIMRAVVLVTTVLPLALAAQAVTPSRWPVAPTPLGEHTEIALAKSAAPPEVSNDADVYVLRGVRYVKVVTGSNGSACLVSRDLHEASRYPICYDREAASTWLKREMMQVELRAQGHAEQEVKRRVEAARAQGQLPWPTVPALAWMMSREQVLFSSPDSSGVRVGAWWPHVMVILPGVSAAQLGLKTPSKVGDVQLNPRDGHHGELIVKVPTWSDGTRAGR